MSILHSVRRKILKIQFVKKNDADDANFVGYLRLFDQPEVKGIQVFLN